ncbi:unnamed protein product [Penicillium salamii]|uniref:Cytochrome c oxidase polypeptide V n=1 Tax=Penicillium salamii TaxID=1612424 RepID=A0A9W4J9B8_9EURO|nr:unnamed protein product [Penicillium salamii]CAG8097299.1 unnamed protein product [Penicillium salamii]CAG8139716.1 unnamed protein product [Penicillium salamii]CAG8192993.1 unnamed protein product [Penicillium salamii]CAG8297274.1 unnamed protein product [Penicillium salamii]
MMMFFWQIDGPNSPGANERAAKPNGASPDRKLAFPPQTTRNVFKSFSIHDPPPLSPKPCPSVLSGLKFPRPPTLSSIVSDFDVVIPPPARRTMFLRTLSRAVPRSTAAIRAAPVAPLNALQTRAASDHAISNPTLASIEKRWEGMPPQEQAELWMQLRDRMKVDWHQMTLQEKKAAYYIAFGAHGPRAQTPKGEGIRVLGKVAQLTAAAVAVFFTIHYFAGPKPGTMSKEWQEASNEYALRENMNPIHGISKPGYEGKGFVQSPPAEKS